MQLVTMFAALKALVTTQKRRQRDAQEEGVAVQLFGRAQY